MSFTVIQAGSNLQLVNDSGVISAPLTLPFGVTLRTDIPPRFVVFGKFVVLVNTPSQPLSVDYTGTVRLLCPRPPRLGPVLAGVAGGALSGTYNGVRYTYITVDPVTLALISESDFSPPSGTVTIASQDLQASGLDISPDAITGRRLYRPTTLGAVNFQWVDLDGNILTSIQDDLPDAGLSIVAAPLFLGTPPDLTLITEWRSRLWGVDRLQVDDLRFTDVQRQYAWSLFNDFPIPSVGSDRLGITGLMSRRESLGVGRQNQLSVVTGTDTTNFAVAKLSQSCGIISQETVAVYRDVAYFLWEDGVYMWSDAGIICLSDGDANVNAGGITVTGLHGRVRSWFATDDYFNRSRFRNAFAHVDPIRNKYRLFLNPAGSSTEIQWVEYDLNEHTWWGPHETGAFTPTSVFVVLDGQLVQRPTFGSSNANLYREQDLRTDGVSTPIVLDVILKRYDMAEPDLNKYWGQLSIIGKAQFTGSLSISITVGELNATANFSINWDMTRSRQRLQRMGTGKHLQLELIDGEVGQDVEIYGIEIDPVNILGRR